MTKTPKKKRPRNGRNARGQFAGEAGPGRKQGVPNKVTVEVKALCAGLVDDPAYRKRLKADLRERKVAPAIEQMLWYFAYGKPTEQIQMSGNVGALPDGMTRAELLERARALVRTIESDDVEGP